MVDRGWENGTPRNHADYRPRTSNGQTSPNNRRKNQEAGNYSYNGSAGNRTNGNRQSQSTYNQAQHRKGENSPFGTGPKGYNAENRRFNNQQGDEPYSYNNRQSQNSQKQPQEHGSNFRTQEDGLGRSRYYGNNRSQPNRERSNDYGNNRPQRNPERNRGRGYTSFNERSIYGDQERREPHPRLQSRPEAFQRRQEGRRPQETQRYAPHREQFEGDYEQFGYDTPAQAESAARKPFQGNRHDRYGQHTMLYQNGHALKGPRPVQRRDAEFRASINEDAEELINRVHLSPYEHSQVHEEAASPTEMAIENNGSENLPLASPNKQTKPSSVSKQTRRATNAGRTKKAEVAPPPSKGPRPSQRGYKWPAP